MHNTCNRLAQSEQQKRIAPKSTYCMVILEDFTQILVFRMMDGLDDETIVSGIIKEAATLSGRAQLRKDILACQRHLFYF